MQKCVWIKIFDYSNSSKNFLILIFLLLLFEWVWYALPFLILGGNWSDRESTSTEGVMNDRPELAPKALSISVAFSTARSLNIRLCCTRAVSNSERSEQKWALTSRLSSCRRSFSVSSAFFLAASDFASLRLWKPVRKLLRKVEFITRTAESGVLQTVELHRQIWPPLLDDALRVFLQQLQYELEWGHWGSRKTFWRLCQTWIRKFWAAIWIATPY